MDDFKSWGRFLGLDIVGYQDRLSAVVYLKPLKERLSVHCTIYWALIIFSNVHYVRLPDKFHACRPRNYKIQAPSVICRILHLLNESTRRKTLSVSKRSQAIDAFTAQIMSDSGFLEVENSYLPFTLFLARARLNHLLVNTTTNALEFGQCYFYAGSRVVFWNDLVVVVWSSVVFWDK